MVQVPQHIRSIIASDSITVENNFLQKNLFVCFVGKLLSELRSDQFVFNVLVSLQSHKWLFRPYLFKFVILFN